MTYTHVRHYTKDNEGNNVYLLYAIKYDYALIVVQIAGRFYDGLHQPLDANTREWCNANIKKELAP